MQEDPNTKVEMLFQPRGAQIEALCALENSRAEGAMRGLVHAATGVGKTYLAAFDSVNYERVLFVAHREEILKQAAVSFKNVRRFDDYGFFYGKQKDTGRSVIVASVATLGRSEYLIQQYFYNSWDEIFEQAEEKNIWNVLDFIGNYEKAGRAPFLLSGGKCPGERTAYDYYEIEYRTMEYYRRRYTEI